MHFILGARLARLESCPGIPIQDKEGMHQEKILLTLLLRYPHLIGLHLEEVGKQDKTPPQKSLLRIGFTVSYLEWVHAKAAAGKQEKLEGTPF